MKKKIIFGAGQNGKKAIDFYGKDCVEYFVDNNEKLIGTMFCDKSIISIGKLQEIAEDYEIVIAVTRYGEVAEQLKGLSIYNYTKFVNPNIGKITSYLDSVGCDNYENIALYGSDEYTIAFLKKALPNVRKKIKYVIDDKVNGDSIKCEEYVVRKLEEVKTDIDAVLIMSPLYHIAHENHVNKKLNGSVMVLNPYKMKTYYSTKDLVINKYENESLEAKTEDEANVKNRNRTDYFSAVSEFVSEVRDETPLFKLVEIETINRCNGVCEFCPVNAMIDPREKHIMSTELFYKIIGQLEELKYDGRISLFSNNEPFLDERIIEFSKYMREHLPFAKIHMFTNGTLLDIEKFKQIIEYLDELIIDNYTQDLHLIKNSQDIKKYCEEHQELIEKVSIVLRKPKEILTSRGGMAPNRKEQKEYSDVTCAFPFQQLIIRPTGQVSLCCNDATGKYTLGDLNEESILDVWYGEQYKKIREEIANGRKNIEICKTCDTFSLYL